MYVCVFPAGDSNETQPHIAGTFASFYMFFFPSLLQERIMTLRLESQHLIFQTPVGEVCLVCVGGRMCVVGLWVLCV